MDVGNGDAGFYDTGEETTGEDTVMIGFYLCMVLAAAFLLLGSLFALAGEHGANWLSGFSLLSKEERARYDRKRIRGTLSGCGAVSCCWGLQGADGFPAMWP